MTNMPFVKMITEFRRGELEADLSARLVEVLEGLRDHGGAGEVSLALKIKRDKHGMVVVDAKVKSVVPRRAVGSSAYFMTADGELTRSDPNQTDIEDVPGVAPRPGPDRRMGFRLAE